MKSRHSRGLFSSKGNISYSKAVSSTGNPPQLAGKNHSLQTLHRSQYHKTINLSGAFLGRLSMVIDSKDPYIWESEANLDFFGASQKSERGKMILKMKETVYHCAAHN